MNHSSDDMSAEEEPNKGSQDTPAPIEPPVPEERTSPRLRAALVAQAREPTLAKPPSRFRDIKPDQLVNTSSMLKRNNWIWALLSSRLFRHVDFSERHIETIKESARDGTVVFAMNHHSLLDYLYFNYAHKRYGLPLVFFGTRISVILFAPIWRIAGHLIRKLVGRGSPKLNGTEMLAYGLEREKPALVFLKRQAFWPWSTAKSSDGLLNTLIAVQKERIHACAGSESQTPRPIIVIPQLLIWNIDPARYRRRGLKRLVFGNPEVPGRLRKFINFLLNRKRAFVMLGKPINLLEFLEPLDVGTRNDVLSRKLRFGIMQALRLEERVIKGPTLKGSKRIREEILRTKEMQSEIVRIAAENERSREHTERKVSRYLAEIAADFSMANIEFMCMSLTLLFSRLYDEIVCDTESLERVREAGRKGPLIILPCHRSHVDYLVISWLFYANGLVPPHIAAGANLNFFPIGYLFRRSGAFFMRRSFKGNEAYSVAFRDYLRKLIKEGYWIEFFLEGGRSRTGKMLAPKYGLLTLVIEAIKSGAASDVHLVPVYLGYEHIIEEQSYTQEMAGATKQKENITSLLRTTRVLWSKYDRLYVNFGETLSCRELLEDANQMDTPNTGSEHTQFVRRTAYRVLAGINDVAIVTPSAATALALLTHPRRGIRREELLGRVGFILEMAGRKQAPLSNTLKNALKIRRQDVAVAMAEMDEAGARHLSLSLGGRSPLAKARGKAVVEVIDEVLSRFIKKKQIRRHRFDDDVVYTPVSAARINLDIYKNNIVHLFIKEAILATAIRGNMEQGFADLERVREEASFLSDIFKHEFVYNPKVTFLEQFQRTMAIFIESGLLQAELGEDGKTRISVPPSATDTMVVCHRVLEPWLEGYWMMVATVDNELSQPTTEKEFIKKVQRLTERRYQEGDLTCAEAGSSIPLKNAIAYLVENKLLQRQGARRDQVLALGEQAAGDPTKLTTLAQQLRRYFCV
jgi:glycerol-3-phosphate O-acyltransferase